MRLKPDVVLRRAGRAVMMLTLGLTACWTAGDGAAGEPVKTAPDVVIYSGTYPGWPWIASTPSGKLLSVWREGSQHMFSAAGKVMISQSNDGGKSWSAPAIVVDKEGIDDRNAAIVALSEAEWLVCYNEYTDSAQSQARTLRTTDGGLTWLPSQPVGDWETRTRSAAIKLSTGRLVLPYYHYDTSLQQSLAAYSDNGGQTWTTVAVPNVPGSFMGNEWSVVELRDHTLAGLCRNKLETGPMALWITKSADHGETWSTPLKTNLVDSRSQSPAHIFLRDGEPWVVYDDARMVSVAIATTSDPDLVTWNVDNRVRAYQYADAPISDGGYPAAVAVSGDQYMVIDYLIKGSKHQIIGTFVTVADVPGDANRDGRVDATDATIVARNWGVQNATFAMGDFNGDQVVNAADASILAAHWSPSGEAAAVPEPVTPALVLGAVICLATARQGGER